MNNKSSIFDFSLQSLFNTFFCVFILIFCLISLFFVDVSKFSLETLAYAVFVLIPLFLMGLIGTIKILKNKSENNTKNLWLLWGLIILIFLVTIWFCNCISSDYYYYLGQWCDSYSKLSVLDGLKSITSISNYTPIYNYYLIFITKLGLNTLYAIKYLTFIFSIILGVSMELLVSKLKKLEFSIIHVLLFMLIPSVCMEYSYWGQCDAIYTSLCLLAFYFALSKKSKTSFLFIGLAFAVKLQFLFIVPILFAMLLIKDEKGEFYLKWKDIWIAPLCYAVNLVPLFVGGGFDCLLVYFKQAGFYNLISQDCSNFCQIYNFLGVTAESPIFNILVYVQVLISIVLVALILFVLLKTRKKRVLDDYDLLFFAICFSFVMVFFMPKMLDRFFFVPVCLSVAMLFAKFDKNNFTLTLLMNIGLFFAMFIILKFSQEWIVPIQKLILGFGTIANFVVLILLFIRFYKCYLKTSAK